ncbi:MAG: DUF6717 family protein [Planctomycetia bacterium]
MTTEPESVPAATASTTPRRRRWLMPMLLVLFGLLLNGSFWWATRPPAKPSANANLVIAPYRHAGTWVFDDERVGLWKEPFVAGVPEMVDALVKDVPDAEKGFRLLFSANPFPGFQKKLTWLGGDARGNDYQLDDPPLKGWICPALFHYYDAAPKNLYVKAEPMTRK